MLFYVLTLPQFLIIRLKTGYFAFPSLPVSAIIMPMKESESYDPE